MVYVANAFSLGMLAEFPASLRIVQLSRAEAQYKLRTNNWRSIVGHESTAALFSADLGVTMGSVRETFRMGSTDQLLVGQYIGPRLAEGVTELPSGATIEWRLVTLY